MDKAEQTVDLNHFVGKQFTLTAVDSSKLYLVRYSADSGGLAFTLDGVTYAAVENPDDGYRSSMDRIAILPSGIEMATPIPPHVVVGRKQTHCEYGAAECVELIDVETGKTVIRFGTDNSDDYYPSFVGEFDPTALAANQSVKP